ncbi:MAG: hypothetical protein OHK0038_10720 [Flammeovirgaceae bacterium]
MFWGCNKNRVYSEYQSIGNLIWEKEQIKKFQANIAEPLAYNLNVELRHHSTIQYGSIEVNLKITTPSGKVLEKPYILYLRDKQTGQLLGEAMGDICDIVCPLENGLMFTETGIYTFELTHLMDSNVLGIAEIGFSIDKPENK